MKYGQEILGISVKRLEMPKMPERLERQSENKTFLSFQAFINSNLDFSVKKGYIVTNKINLNLF
ncbi:MAG: hypothetical protein WC025_02285 [Candidatus Magasanikbacteria bacterium]